MTETNEFFPNEKAGFENIEKPKNVEEARKFLEESAGLYDLLG